MFNFIVFSKDTYFSFSFLIMLLGPAGSQAVCAIAGATIHRRSVVISKIHLDLHCRLSDSELGSSGFNDPGFLGRLGAAFGDMKPCVFDDFCATAVRRATNADPARITRTSMFFSFPDDLRLFCHLLETDFGQLLRNMMCEWLLLDSYLIFIIYLAMDYRNFLSLSALYFEPSQQKNSARMMIYIGQQLSLYCGVPYKTSSILPVSLQEDMANGSM